jgi:ribose 5-phosphate isomerase B
MAIRVVTENTVRDLIAKGIRRLPIAPGTIITSSAADTAAFHGIEIVESPLATQSGSQSLQSEKEIGGGEEGSKSSGNIVAFGSDHGGFQLKEALKKYAQTLGYVVVDLGTHNEDPCDYPEFAYAVARAVAGGEAWRGIMVDGAGIGSCVVANKVPGVRAACCHNEFVAKNAREHNDTNVLTLGSRVTGVEVCKEVMKIWLETWFAGGRHKQRVDKIIDVERRFLK